MPDYEEVTTPQFDKGFRKIVKKFRRADKDFNALIKTIKENKETTRQTERISGLGQAYETYKVYKTRMHIIEVQGYLGRVIWHIDESTTTLIFLDIYLKNDRENHDPLVIAQGLSEYYGEPTAEIIRVPAEDSK